MKTQALALQAKFIAIRENKAFQTFVVAIIVISALVIGAHTYELPDSMRMLVRAMDVFITVFFLIEILIRLAAEKSIGAFFRKGWNVFDFIIVTASLIPLENSEVALLGRLLRIFRVLRLVSMIPELRVLVDAFLQAIPRMGYVSLLMFIIFYIYAAMGSMLFATINPVLWDNISISMLTLFRVATFEDWTDVMYETMAVYPLSWTYYISFIFIVAFVFLNMMIGIVLETLQKEHEKFDREHDEGEAGDVLWLREHAQQMDQRLERIEALLQEQKSPHT